MLKMQHFVHFVITLCLTCCAVMKSFEGMEIQTKMRENDLLHVGPVSKEISLNSITTTVSTDLCSPNPCKNNGTCKVKDEQFSCNCPENYGGDRCEIKCKCENGKCHDMNGEIVCVCNPEHGLYKEGVCKACECGKGGNCTFDLSLSSDGKMCICLYDSDESTGKCLDPCEPNPCKNGGGCVGNATCFCPSTHYGKFCETCKCENGFCEVSADGNTSCKCFPGHGYVSSTACRFCNCGQGSNCTFTELWSGHEVTCICKEGYKNIKIRNRISHCQGSCEPNPCRNGGQCTVKGYDLECRCKGNFDGPLCETVSCSLNPCKNGGTCYVKDEKVYCNCLGNYDGDRCERNLCSPDPCNNRGKCTVQDGKIFCDCRPPYDGETCEKNLCYPNPCLNNGKCDVTRGVITCSCIHPFIGDRCERECKCENGKCEEINGNIICLCNPEHGLYEKGICKACECGKGGNCTFDLSLSSDGKKCICPYGLDERTGKCIDPCEPNPCKNGGQCKDAKCLCPSTHYGEFCEKCNCDNGFCEETAEGNTFCKCPSEWGLSSPISCKRCSCGPDSNCTFTDNELLSNKTCLCKEGYKDYRGICTGFCDPNPCRNGGQCVLKGSDIECNCKPNFGGRLCESETCSPNPCKNNGTCNVKDQKVYCSCPGNYDGDRCERNLCLPEPCNYRGECKVQNDKFVCDCRPPYDGETCEKNLCYPNPCLHKGKCNVTNGTVTCSCIDPFIGARCEKECDCKNGFCEENADGKTTCMCPPEWGLSGLTECTKCNCGEDSNCTFTGLHKTCICKEGYTDIRGECMGTTLKVSLSTSAENSTRITDGTPYLTTVSGLSLSTLNLTSTEESSVSQSQDLTESTTVFSTTLQTTLSTAKDPCAVNPCHNGGICKTESNGTKCYCIAPFHGELCNREPCFPNPCMNGGLCKVHGRSFFCKCISPYCGPLCENDPCVWSPCKNGGICKIVKGDVQCYCTEPFSGEFCESRHDRTFQN